MPTEQYHCSVPTVNRQEAKTKPVFVVPEGVTDGEQIHWPMIPVLGVEPFQIAACAEMSKYPNFDGAKIINYSAEKTRRLDGTYNRIKIIYYE